jgi:hypothetical protein
MTEQEIPSNCKNIQNKKVLRIERYILFIFRA